MSRIVLALAIVIATSAPAQVANLQTEKPEGLAIYGTVRVPGTREPVPGVVVRRIGPDSLLIHRMLNNGPGVATDASGRFAFTGLEAGSHDLRVSLQGESTVLRSRRVSLEGGLPVEVDLWVMPESRVSGRVLDSDSQPVAGACVDVRRSVWSEGGLALAGPNYLGAAIQSCDTDENGAYSIRAVPGQYYLRVRKAETDVILDAAPQYYPGTADLAEAVPITVAPGVDLNGLDVHLEQDEQYRVRFRLPLPEYVPGVPQPLASYLDEGASLLDAWIRPAGPNAIRTGPVRMGLESTGEDLWQTIPLPAGDYELLLQYPGSLAGDVKEVLDWDAWDPRWARLSPIGRVSFLLEHEDLELGTIAETPKSSVGGRVVFRPAEGTEAYAGQLPALIFRERGFSAWRRTVPAPDGTFSVQWLFPGVFEVEPEDVPAGWYVAAIRSGGRDLLRHGLEVGGGPSNPIEVVFANDAAMISGAARNVDGSLVPDARIVLIPPADQRGPLLRFPTTSSDHSGAYLLEDLPPGSYRLLALDVAGNPDTLPYWESPDFLRLYELRGERITIDPGSRLTIDPEAILLVD